MLSFLYGVYSMIKRPDTLTVVHIGLKTLYRYKFLFYVLVLILLLRFRARGGVHMIRFDLVFVDSIRSRIFFGQFDSTSKIRIRTSLASIYLKPIDLLQPFPL